MGRIILVLGGARSGKSEYAAGLAKQYSRKVAFIATGEAKDPEMRERIRLHKKTRPKHWRTFEEAKNIALLLEKIGNKFECLVVDCLTLLVSNLLLQGSGPKLIENKVAELLKCLKKMPAKAVIVSNEVGLGIVPQSELGRHFRDIAGRINQLVAGESDEVYFMVSGIPWKIK